VGWWRVSTLWFGTGCFWWYCLPRVALLLESFRFLVLIVNHLPVSCRGFMTISRTIVMLAFSLLLSLATTQTRVPNLPQLDEYVKHTMEKAQLPGLAYAVVKNGEVVHMKAFGIARSDGRPMTTQTVMNTASVGKTFTALAIQQLVSAGKLELDSPVQHYLPWFTLADLEAAKTMTVRHMLEQTSGLSTADGNRPFLFRPGLNGEELVRKMATLGINRPVGQDYEYSNLNYLILGEVVVAVSGQSYEQYLQANIFDRLGMKYSFFSPEAVQSAGLDLADVYRLLFGFPVKWNRPLPLGAIAGGQHYTTVEDMARYMMAFSNHGELEGVSAVTAEGQPSKERLNYSTTWQSEFISDPFYGNGFSGAWITYTSGIEYLPNQHFGVVVLANANTSQAFNTTSAFDIAYDVMRLYHGWSLPSHGASARTLYLAADAVLFCLAGFVISRAWCLRGWRERIVHKRTLKSHWPWVIVELILPGSVLAYFPIWATGLKSPLTAWERFVFSLPDIGYSLLFLNGALLVIGMTRSVVMLKGREHNSSQVMFQPHMS
jgi:CubicO group peptidase (beta-lactamase class C family)